MLDAVLTILFFIFVPLAALFIIWNFIAFIVFIAVPKRKAELREKAKNSFIISSGFLISALTLTVLTFAVMALQTAIRYKILESESNAYGMQYSACVDHDMGSCHVYNFSHKAEKQFRKA